MWLKSNYEHEDKGCPKMFNMIIGEYFLSDGLNTTESPKVFHCAPVSPSYFIKREVGSRSVCSKTTINWRNDFSK